VFIKRIELQGFKSVGARPLSLQLERGLTVITGPNGSGKSNVLDALAFCLGESSLKRLRVARLSALLHSSGGRTVERCRASVTLDNSDGVLPIEASTVIIAREMDSSGESRFYVNGRRVSKGELEDLLSAAGLLPGGLWLLPQGTVTRVADLNPVERRRLVEELAGLERFEAKKAEALRELEEADRKLEFHRGQVGIRREELLELEAQRNDRLRLRLVELYLRRLRAGKLAQELEALRAHIAEAEAGLGEKARARASLEGQRQELLRALDALEQERARLLASLVGEGRGPAELAYSVSEKEGRVGQLERRREELLAELGQLEATLSDLAQAREKNREERARVGQELSSLLLRIRELDAAKRRKLAELREEERGASRLSALLSRRTTEQARLEERVSSLRRRREELLMRSMAEQEAAGVLRERMEALKKRIEEAKATREGLERALAALEELRAGILSEAQGEREALQRLYGRWGAALQNLGFALRTLQEGYRLLLSSGARPPDEAEAKLEELFRKGLCGRYLGRLGELIGTSHPSVLSALGPWLGAHVFEDPSAPAKALRLAERFDAHPLVVCLEPGAAPAEPPPEGAGAWVAQLVPREELRRLVHRLTGGALLAEDEGTALRLAQSGQRVVLPDGRLYEPWGLGALRSSPLSSYEARAVVSDLNALQEAVGRLLARALEMVKEGERRLPSLERKVARHAALEGEREAFRRVARRAARAIAQLEALRSKLEARLAARERALSLLRERLEALSQKEGELEEQLRALSLPELRSGLQRSQDRQAQLRNELFELEKQAAELRGRAPPLRAERRTLLEQAKRLSQLMQQARARQKEARAELPRLEAELKQEREALEVLRRERDALMEKLRSIQPTLDALAAERERLEAKRRELEAALGRLDREEAALRGQLARFEARREALARELEGLGEEPLLAPGEEAERALRELEQEREALMQRVNMGAEEAYEALYRSYRSLSQRLRQLELEREAIVKMIQEVEAQKRGEFLKLYTRLNEGLQEVFQELTGGHARLELEDPESIFGGGLFLLASFPGKDERESNSLSGGERTAAALSFSLAVQALSPSPILALDEVDAHLDYQNAQRFAAVLARRAMERQIIVTSLRESMVAAADVVYGLYSVDGVTRAVKYRPLVGVKRPGAA
jgi:chromosome segregation protein